MDHKIQFALIAFRKWIQNSTNFRPEFIRSWLNFVTLNLLPHAFPACLIVEM